MRFSNYNEAAFAGWEVNDESEHISPFVIIGKKPSAHVCSKPHFVVKFFETGVQGETDKSELCFG